MSSFGFAQDDIIHQRSFVANAPQDDKKESVIASEAKQSRKLCHCERSEAISTEGRYL